MEEESRQGTLIEVLSETPLKKLVESFRFKPLSTGLYILPGVFLLISMPAFLITAYAIYTRGVEEALTAWYRPLAILYLGYLATTSYLAYSTTNTLKKHLLESGITSYYWLRLRRDTSALKALYRGALARRDLPSPITSLLITLFTGGIAYLVILHLLEKNLRNHCYGEESLFLGKTYTRRIGSETGLIDIAATLLTIGGYLSYWGWRVARTYNKHLELIHSNHPNPPEKPLKGFNDYLPDPGLSVLAFTLLGTGIYSLLGLAGIPPLTFASIAYGLLLPAFSIQYRTRSIARQLAYTYAYVYLVLIVSTIIGFASAHSLMDLAKDLEKMFAPFRRGSFPELATMIFMNNYAISLVALAPIIGSLGIGIGVTNAGIVYGVILLMRLLWGGIGSFLNALLLPVMPHAILELLGYAVFIVVSTRITQNRKGLLSLFVLGTLILLLAAVIEALTITLTQP
ncbi:MAG: stage II sporulation protein M [Thermoprotei archaeon]